LLSNYAGACFLEFSCLNYFHNSANKKNENKTRRHPKILMRASNSCCHNIIFLSFCYLITETNRVCVCTQCQTKPMRTQPQVFISRVFPPLLTSSADSCRIASKLSRQRPVFSANNSFAHEKGSRPDGIRRLRCPIRAARLAGFPGK
jgi:hypothetical protein